MNNSLRRIFLQLVVSLAGLFLSHLSAETLADTSAMNPPILPLIDSATKPLEKLSDLSGDLAEENLGWTPQPTSSHFRFLTGHGISLGQGRASEAGLHGMDSLSLTFRQYPGAGRISEKVSVSTDFSFQRSTLQTGIANFSLQFREQGLTLQAVAGATYASLVFNTLSRTEKTKGQAELVSTFAASVSKAFALDVDSTWEWTLGGGYDNYGGEFKTWDGFTSLGKTWKEFDWLAEASGYQQHQSQTRTIKCKLGSGKLCSQTQDSSAVEGFSLAVFGEWDHKAHFLSVKASLDWQMTTSVQSRYRTIGVGYIYSPLYWLNLGVSAIREKALDATTGSSYWLLGSTVSLKF